MKTGYLFLIHAEPACIIAYFRSDSPPIQHKILYMMAERPSLSDLLCLMQSTIR